MTKKSGYVSIARLYDLLDLPFEYGRYRPLRRFLFEGVGGSVLDAGVGTGRNMPFYPTSATVIGIDVSAAMLDRAKKRKARLGVDVALRQMDVIDTDFADRQFNHIVATFLFCVLVPEQQAPALRELRRICQPDGEIRILEYVYSKDPFRRFVMRLWTPWIRVMYGAAFDRNTERYVGAAGLDLVEQRFLYRDIIKLLVLRPR